MCTKKFDRQIRGRDYDDGIKELRVRVTDTGQSLFARLWLLFTFHM